MKLKNVFLGTTKMSTCLGLLTILVINLACSNYELDEEAMDYLWSLPNLFTYDAKMMEELEQNTKRYGKPLERHNYIDKWENIYYTLIYQNLLWGRYEKAEKIITEIDYFDSYGDSFFTVPLVYLSSQKFEEFYSQVDFKRIEKLDPDLGVENMRKILKPPRIDKFSLPDPEYFQNPTKFSYWFIDQLGCRMLLLLSAGLYGGYYQGLEEENAVKLLDKVLISDEYQAGFVNSIEYIGLTSFSFLFKIHVFYEKYLRKINDLGKVELLQNIRFELAKKCNQIPEFSDNAVSLRLLDLGGELPAAKEN